MDAEPALTLDCAIERLSISLVQATLRYRLTLTNLGPFALADLAIAGDMIGAHASLSAEAQLAPGEELPELHHLAMLATGENVTFDGELRLPLAAIAPVRSGNAALFVPLLRLRVAAPALSTTFLLGEPPEAAEGRLRPIRLDLGPKIYPEILARRIAG
jgi:hypothetical protein